jgi:hypothetical protein
MTAPWLLKNRIYTNKCWFSQAVEELCMITTLVLEAWKPWFSSTVSIPPVLPVCGNNRAAAVVTQKTNSFEETPKALRASQDSLEIGERTHMKSTDVMPQHQEVESHKTPTDTVLNAVARTVGATLGTIALGSAKVLGHSAGAGSADKSPKQRSRVSENATSAPGIEFRNRLSRYKRKKARHAQKLRRSHTKG